MAGTIMQLIRPGRVKKQKKPQESKFEDKAPIKPNPNSKIKAILAGDSFIQEIYLIVEQMDLKPT